MAIPVDGRALPLKRSQIMNALRLAIYIVMMISFSGCAHYFPPLHEERIEQYRKTCESLGFNPQTDEHSKCVLDLEKSYLSGRGSSLNRTNTTNNDVRTHQMIDQDRWQKQILNHGAGGCTPNFATGGCL